MATVYEQMNEHGTVLLAGIVGSTAYGLTTPESDTDRLGVYAVPTDALFAVTAPADTITMNEPGDAAFHEAAKYARLALSVNPTVTELLWLPSYEIVSPLGQELINLRTAFLSADRVRNAYLGYATAQFKRLTQRQDGTFSSDTRNRSRKHARHMARLVNQGHALYTTGQLTVQVPDPDWYHAFSQQTPDDWGAWFTAASTQFAAASSPLPDTPNVAAVNAWLVNVRHAFLPR
jgi:predicted nucleotidyltransferase